ncbi:hypothetical protein UFOVP653_37 [uncultured Caudovirales phage]|uniref:Uncharacterized protein n=1 Tax=uncultured Caudovirales phage TaxID=2100421 RepID=A0A6J5N7H9_9CAUD|nr:hypothetical protein UFOVP653_37 [uncultured Caudovirales phage]
MTKHTPGPWFLAEKVEGKHTTTNMRRIRSEREGMEHGAVCEVYGIADGSEAHANARLVASAPELLEALKNLVLCSERWEDTHTALVMDAARAAIAKATS